MNRTLRSPNLRAASICMPKSRAPNPENSLTIYNASSSQKTLGIMAVIAVIGMPFMLLYTGVVYWTFRGEVSWRSIAIEAQERGDVGGRRAGSLPQ